jgi:hypothetical protein
MDILWEAGFTDRREIPRYARDEVFSFGVRGGGAVRRSGGKRRADPPCAEGALRSSGQARVGHPTEENTG